MSDNSVTAGRKTNSSKKAIPSESNRCIHSDVAGRRCRHPKGLGQNGAEQGADRHPAARARVHPLDVGVLAETAARGVDLRAHVMDRRHGRRQSTALRSQDQGPRSEDRERGAAHHGHQDPPETAGPPPEPEDGAETGGCSADPALAPDGGSRPGPAPDSDGGRRLEPPRDRAIRPAGGEARPGSSRAARADSAPARIRPQARVPRVILDTRRRPESRVAIGSDGMGAVSGRNLRAW